MHQPRKVRTSSIFAFAAAMGLALAPISVTYAQAQQAAAVQSISARDKAEGAKVHPQLLAEFGGAATGPQASYVETVGKNIAVHSGLSNARGDFTVTLLNSPVNNAFAIPGGYIYVTRQLVALMNNEAELAGVLGHEVGHVAARHSKQRQKAATRNSILGVLGQVLGSAVGGGFGNIIAQGSQFGAQALTASFSRTQETQADNLGIQYLRSAGYDPRALSTVLQSLANQTALDARLMGTGNNRVPEWASTHPNPASRVRAALVRAGTTAGGITNRDVFLSRIDGIIYGDDPKQGVVEGNRFTHPDLRLTFQAPNGYYVMNGTRAVTIGGGSGKAEFRSAAYDGNLESYVRSVFASLGGQNQQIPISQLERTTVNGIPAVVGSARVASGSGQVDVVVFAYEFANGQAYHFTTLSPAGQSGAFEPMFRSLRRISANEAAAIKPRRIAVVTARSGDTVRSLAGRMAYSDYQLERFLVLNGLTANSTVSAGQKLKLVVS